MTALIRGTKTQTGLTVKAAQLKGDYPTQVKVSDEEMAALKLTRRKICPQWNYRLHPRTQILEKHELICLQALKQQLFSTTIFSLLLYKQI